MPFDDLMVPHTQQKNMVTATTASREKLAKNHQKSSASNTGSDMSFGEDEEEKEGDGFNDSPKGSVSSEHNFDYEQANDEEDEFEDAEEGTLMLSDKEQMKKLK